jgi:hypothetical protein
VSSPRFRPRAYCRPEKSFGTDDAIRWLRARSEADADQLGAARIQHDLARRIRTALRGAELSVETYAQTHGLEPMRLRRLLRGDVIMRLEDVANARRNILGRVQGEEGS